MKRTRKRNGTLHPDLKLQQLRPPRATASSTLGSRGSRSSASVLITGGAGFIGTNLADHYLRRGERVRIYDNLSRPGVEKNLDWLCHTHGDAVEVEVADVADCRRLGKAVQGVSKVFHFAAQVAVTTSLENPFHDFAVNARGTLNLLEALRALVRPPSLVFTSTNKVYGALDNVLLRSDETRYTPEEAVIRNRGFNELNQLDFHSPYGCSKGAAEQYVLDYSRTFGIPAAVFRMSCIYGPHQFGTEDQGWVAHFLIRALEGSPVRIYGDGRQVRDVLFVDDLVQAFCLAQENMPALAGHAFNIGGGVEHTTSLLELLELITHLQGAAPLVTFDEWRPADQRYYVSDISKFSHLTGWAPKIGVRQGVTALFQWLKAFGLKDPAESTLGPRSGGRVGSELGRAKALNGLSTDPLELNGSQQTRSKRLWKLRGAAAGPFRRTVAKAG